MQGHADQPLNDLGREQAAQVAAALASYPLDAIYSSDLSRAFDTARAIAAHHAHLPLHTSALWRERDYGRFQGMTLPEVEAIDPHAAQQWRSRVADFAPDGGENLLQFQARIAQQLQAVAAQHAGQSVAIVAHGGVLDIIWRIVHGLPVDTPRAWALPNTGINHLRDAGGIWQVLDWGNTAHLLNPAVVRDETIA
jgi:probable phosphoglycerate mutase